MLLGMFFIISDINHGFIIDPLGLGDPCISISYGIDIKPLDKYDVLCVVRWGYMHLLSGYLMLYGLFLW